MSDTEGIDRGACYFCRQPPVFTHVGMYNDIPPAAEHVAFADRYPSRGLPLCQRCYDALVGAAYRGLLLKATGVRWWNAIYAPHLNNPSKLPWLRKDVNDDGTAGQRALDR